MQILYKRQKRFNTDVIGGETVQKYLYNLLALAVNFSVAATVSYFQALHH